MAPTDNPAVGVVPSTNEVFFKSAGSFEITFVAPYTGTFQATLTGRPGSYEFGGGGGLCTQTNIAKAGSTNSFRLCTNAGGGCEVYSFDGPNAPDPTNQFDLVAGVNTLWLRKRELCALASQLTFTPSP